MTQNESDNVVEKRASQSLRPFWVLWSGQAISLFGSQIVQFALIWWLTQETGSATILAIASLVGLVPQVVLGPFVGVLVDRWSRRWTMFIADVVIATASVGLAYLYWSGAVEIWHIFALLFIRALGGAFHWPAMQASTTLMVPDEKLTQIQGLNQMLQGGLNIVSAPLGAILVGALTMPMLLGIDVATALFAIVPLLFIAVPQPKKTAVSDSTQAAEKPSYMQELRLGLRYVWSWKGLLMIMLMAALVNFLLTPAASLLPLLITQHFEGGAMQLALMESALGVGIVLGGILLSVWGGFKRRIYTTLIGLVGLGVAMASLGFVPANLYFVAVIAAFVAGGTMSLTNGPIMAIMQSAVDPAMQGRVFTLLSSVAMAMSPLSLIVAGPLADAFGVTTWFIVGGSVTVLVGLSGFVNKAVLSVEDGRSGEQIANEENVEAETPLMDTAVAD